MGLSSRIERARWIVFLTPVLALGVGGCGASKGTVSGKVYYQDAPLKGGTVTFVGSDKQSYLAEIQEDGSYSVENLPLGEAGITVETETLKPPNLYVLQNRAPADVAEEDKPPDFAARAKRFVPIPGRYADPDQSGLRYTVQGGKQQHDLKLTN
jgi:hypothetical protein